MQVAQLPGFARERWLQAAAARGLEDGVAGLVAQRVLAPVEPDHERLGRRRRLGDGVGDARLRAASNRSMNTCSASTPSVARPASTTSMYGPGPQT